MGRKRYKEEEKKWEEIRKYFIERKCAKKEIARGRVGTREEENNI